MRINGLRLEAYDRDLKQYNYDDVATKSVLVLMGPIAPSSLPRNSTSTKAAI